MSASSRLVIRPARAGEGALVLAFIRELAVYEKLEHEAQASVEQIDAALFGPSPKAFCDVAEWEGKPVGFAFWFYNFSTFDGKHGIYLEDLFVRPEARGNGIGKALLAHLAQRCIDEDLSRLQWWVLDWNAPAIAFYRSLGAEAMEGWTVKRVSGAALKWLADAGAAV